MERIERIGNICEVLNGYAFKSDEYVAKGIRVMRITNVQKGKVVDDEPKYFPIERNDEISKHLLREGDLLMSLTGNVGRVGILPSEMLPAALNQRVACLRKKSEDLSMKYLFYILNSDIFESDCIFNASGIAQKNMSTRWLEEYTIPLPSLQEQERIVAELDLLTEIIDKQKQQLKEFDNLAQSIFYDMFGNPNINDMKWEYSTFKSIFKLKSGDGLIGKNFMQGNYPVYGGNGISGYHNKYNKDGDYIIVGRVGAYCGNVRYVKGQFWLTDNAFQALFDNTVLDYVFVCYLLNAINLHQYANQAAQPVISNVVLKDIQIIMPPKAIQREFAKKIQSIESQKQSINRSIAESQKLFDYTMDKYFG